MFLMITVAPLVHFAVVYFHDAMRMPISGGGTSRPRD